ncbi:MAG TPA: SDR family oxidoreductase [Anaerolineaceae bacterium]|nr:SDR family oxidoreductase [Anaerolineaceae bacterium]
MDLIGKVALVTGSGVRLGRAIAKAMAMEGCNLALHYNHSVEEAESLQEELKPLGGRYELFQADLSDPEQIEKLISSIYAQFSQLDVLVNNAGIYPKGKGLETDSQMLQQVFSVNLFSQILLIKAFALHLPEDASGKIVNISDSKVFKHGIDHFAYRLTKSGINEMTMQFALELAPRITVNAVAPGIMMPLAGLEGMDMQPVAERRVPLKRIGSPELIAENVIHLLKQDFITGQIIRVDGGENI